MCGVCFVMMCEVCFYNVPSGNLRIGTAKQLYDTTLYISENMHRVTVPFIVLHGATWTTPRTTCSSAPGTEDAVTHHAHSELLYQTAASQDKTLKLYEGMWHALLVEPDGGGEIVQRDIVDWLLARVAPSDA